MSGLNDFLLGAISMGFAVAGLFFLRFYRDTRDRLFFWFAAAFSLMGINRVVQATMPNPAEGSPLIYLVRAAAYGLILVAILGKNLHNK